jgi:hypothetical protein
MSPLLLGAAWILFVISCFASMTPMANSARPRTSSRPSSSRPSSSRTPVTASARPTHSRQQQDDQPI